jgi:RecB family exonuclease
VAPADNLEPDIDPTPRVSIPHISFSQLSTYMRCSMQYYFAYILRLRQKPSLPLAIGSGGHTALEHNGRHKLKLGTDYPVNDMLELASTFIDFELKDLPKADATDGERGKAKDNAIASLRYYQTQEAPTIIPAGVEIEFNLDLNDPNEENVEPIRIVNGKIDLITTSAAVRDYKFTSRAKSQSEVDLSPQLSLYGKVFQTLTGKYPASTGFQMFVPPTRDRPSGVLKLDRDKALMTPVAQESRFNRLRFQFQQVEKAIRTGIYLPTDDPKVCSWCGYRDRCQSSLVTDFEAAQIRGDL